MINIIKNPLRKIYFLSTAIFNIPFKKKFKENYGEFDNEDYEEYKLTDLPNESTNYKGEIIKWSKDNVNENSRVLLCGEDNKIKNTFKECLPTKDIVTSFLTNSDFNWNFEEDLPKGIGKYDLIISKSMLEHIIDPYKHFKDLVSLLNKEGVLIVLTATQFCPYHRFPIDTLRFFPDWFEEVADRCNVKVIKKKLKSVFIFYMFKKLSQKTSKENNKC